MYQQDQKTKRKTRNRKLEKKTKVDKTQTKIEQR
jgi:hypothetical protein